MEKAGNARDADLIHKCTDEMLEKYMSYMAVLEPFCEDEEENAAVESISGETLQRCFEDMKAAVEELDMDEMESVIQEMGQYCYEGQSKKLFERLAEAVQEVDVDSCEAIIQEWQMLV